MTGAGAAGRAIRCIKGCWPDGRAGALNEAFLVFAAHTLGWELLTTGQTAKLLGSSRQQVVNLCERGDLPFVRVGAHRRIRREHVEALLQPRQALTRDQLKSLWLHQAVAGSPVVDPDEVLGKASANLDRLLRQHQGTMAEVWLRRWQTRSTKGLGPSFGR